MDLESLSTNSIISMKPNETQSNFKQTQIQNLFSSSAFNNNSNSNFLFDENKKIEIENLNSGSLIELNLTSRVKYLEEELANAQADKEFVWSLWRQLQSTNPDVTNAISTVVQREKEKSELKDRKVLEILKVKDKKIEELCEKLEAKEKQCDELNEKFKKLEAQFQTNLEELKFMEINAKTLNDKEQMYEQMLRGRDDKYEKAMRENESEKQHLISKLRDLVKEIADKQEKESKLHLECERQKDTIDLLNKQIKLTNDNYEKLMDELNQFRNALDNTNRIENEKLKNDLKSKSEQNEQLRNELNELWSKFNLNIDYISQQEKIIKQLKSIQADLQNTIKNQQVAFECENGTLKKMYDQMSKKYEESLHAEKNLLNENYLVKQQHQQQQALQIQQMKLNEKSNNALIKNQQNEIEQLKLKLKLNLRQLNDKKYLIDELNKKITDLESLEDKEIDQMKSRRIVSERLTNNVESNKMANNYKSNSILSRSKSVVQLKSVSFNLNNKNKLNYESDGELSTARSHSLIERKRSKSCERQSSTQTNGNSIDDLSNKLKPNDSNRNSIRKANQNSNEINENEKDQQRQQQQQPTATDSEENKLNKVKLFYENLCKAKDEELKAIRLAHQRRLERLISLEKQHKLLKEHLNSYVDEEANLDEHRQLLIKSDDNNIINNVALNDTEKLKLNENVGYTRKENDLINAKLKLTLYDNKQLLHENLDLKEKIDLLSVKCEEQNELIQNLKLELNLKLEENEEKYEKTKTNYLNELKQVNEEKLLLKKNLSNLDEKFGQIDKERIKYVEMCSKLSEENKKLYKKWFQIHKNENKFRSLLIDQINKRSQNKSKRKNLRLNKTNLEKHQKTQQRIRLNRPNQTEENQNDLLLELVSTSLSSPRSESSLLNSSIQISSPIEQNQLEATNQTNEDLKTLKSKISKLKQYKQDKEMMLLRRRLDELNAEKVELIAKLESSKLDNEKLNKELNSIEIKFKNLKNQNENSLTELNSLKKKEIDLKEKETILRKQEEQAKDDLKKSYESKIRQLTNDLTKQINSNKIFKSENEKLTDKLKVNEEKLNHTDRDNSQKKQLIEFYKKKLEDFSEKEKNEIKLCRNDELNEPLNDLKSQIKKLNESLEKSKVEIKSLKTRLQSVQAEKSSNETKLNAQEKLLNDSNEKYESIRKEKSKLENSLKQSKQKIKELDLYVKELETVAESKIQHLSESSQQTLALAQLKLKYAFKSVENYERMFKYLYESLINRCIELRKEIKLKKRSNSNSSNCINKKAIQNDEQKTNQMFETSDDNFRMALNIASTVLNLSSNELEDILSTNSIMSNETNDVGKKQQQNKRIDLDEKDDLTYQNLCKKLMFEFDQYLNSGKKEKDYLKLNDSSSSSNETICDYDNNGNDDPRSDHINKNICNLISQRLNDVLSYERELASLNVVKSNDKK